MKVSESPNTWNYAVYFGRISTGNQPSYQSERKEQLLVYLDSYKMLTDWIGIENGKWKFVDFTGRVIVSDGFTPNSIRESINAALNDHSGQ